MCLVTKPSICFVSYSEWIGMTALVPPYKKPRQPKSKTHCSFCGLFSLFPTMTNLYCGRSSLCPLWRLANPSLGNSVPFFFWLSFIAWVWHEDQFVFMTHCFLESVSNALSRESGTFSTLHVALLDCPVEPPQARAKGWAWPVLSMVCAHSFCPAWLG